jgi:hypothetical protein
MALTRISMTIPRSLVKAADRLARALGRSRSWVIAAALREYLEGSGMGPGEAAPKGVVREPLVQPYDGTMEVAEARRRRLRAELALTPGERLRRAWELGYLGRRRQPRGRREQVITFESYEDFYEWKKSRLIGL